MKFNEFDLEEAIWQDYKTTGGEQTALSCLMLGSIMKRQLRIGNYGVADLVGFDIDIAPNGKVGISATVYELKRGCIDIKALLQSCRYAAGLKHLVNIKFININIVLIGSSIDMSSEFVYLLDRLNNVDLYIAHLSMSGIEFEYVNTNFGLVDKGDMNPPLSFSEIKSILK